MNHTFTKHQILNITTGRLYTKMGDIYDFFDTVVESGIMTHMLPNASKAIVPILETKLAPKEDFFHNEWKPDSENPEITFEFTSEDRKTFWSNYTELPSIFESLGKNKKP